MNLNNGLESKKMICPQFKVGLLACALLLPVFGTHDVWAASAVGYTQRTLKFLVPGNGCTIGCHGAGAQGGTVVLAGPSSLTAGQTGIYTITNNSTSAVANNPMGFNVATSDTTAVPALLAGTATNMLYDSITGELVHTENGTNLKSFLAQTNASGAASYTFKFTMPSSAGTGSSHTLYGSSRVALVSWNETSKITTTAAPLAGVATPSALAFGQTSTLSSTGGGVGTGAVTFSTSTPAICSVSLLTLTTLTVGTCSLTATKAADTTTTSLTANFNVVISKANQTITFGAAPTVVVAGTGTVTATGGASGNPVTFTSSTPSVCTTSGTNGATVTGLIVGTCTIAANQALSADYNAASQVTQSFSIGKGSQTITFGAAPAVVVAGTGTVTATGGASGNPVTFTSSTPSACTTSGTNGATVTGVIVGTCTIAANQALSADYNAASQVTQSFSIGKGSQTITFGAAPSVAVGGTGSVTATGGASGNPVTFTSLATGVCTVSGTNGSIVTGVAAGTCTIAANQPLSTNYNAAPQVTQSFTVGLTGQTITFGATPTVVAGGTGTVSATGGSSGNPVIFTSNTVSVCTTSGANGSTLTGITVGSCTILASQAGNALFSSATQTQSFSVGIGSQNIILGAAPTVVVAGTGTVAATGGGSGNAVTFSSITAAVCTTSGTNGSTVTAVTAGTCTIAANQVGNTNYSAAAQVTQSFPISKGSQNIVFSTAPTIVVGGSGNVSATGGASGSAVIFSSTTATVCTTSGTDGATVTGVTVGTCIIAANQAGNTNYSAAPQVSQSFPVSKGSQTITFGTTPSLAAGGNALLSASGGASTSPVVFSSTTTAVCTTSGANGAAVSGVAAGTCTISADQAGDANFNAAATLTLNFTVVAPNVLQSAASRKVHGTAGNMDMPITLNVPLAGAVSVEPRNIGSGHLILFTFSSTVTTAGAATTTSGVVSSVTVAGSEIQVLVTGITDTNRAQISVSGVDPGLTAAGPAGLTVTATIGFLVGDVNGSGKVDAADVSAVKARSGQTTDSSNFLYDINASGAVNAADVSATKARAASGTLLLP